MPCDAFCPVLQISSSQLYINFLLRLSGDPKDVVQLLTQKVSKFISVNAPGLLKQQVDEIELRFIIGEGTEVKTSAMRQSLHRDT